MNNKKHILIVDDNKENLKVVSNFLKERDYQIVLALNGNSALDLLQQYKIDLILLDIMMPEMNGFDVCRQLKSNDATRGIPVVFLTAKNEAEDIVEGFKTGGVDYITKPFNKQELHARVQNHLELAESKRIILEMNNTRDYLYSIIAHDLRSPFAGIVTTIDALENGYLDVNSNDFKEIISGLSKTTKETSALLDNLLEWTRLQSSNITLEPKNNLLLPLVLECVNQYAEKAAAKNIEIKTEINENLSAFFDARTILTVIRNLFSNAIKFTPELGEICIRAMQKEMLKISITDSGIGMDKEIIQQIFNDNRTITTPGTQNEKGSGLGLMLVKDFVKNNNGKIDIDSTPGKGTTFNIYLPLTEQ